MSTAAARLRAALVFGAVAWAVAIVGAPLLRASRPGTPVAVAAALPYVIGARICHQRPERSFHTHGVPWPVCGRCTGLYLSGALGLLVAAMAVRRQGLQGLPPRRVLVVAAVPTVATWVLEVVGLWNPGTPLRALAAIPLGLAIGWVLHAALQPDPGDRRHAAGRP